MRKKEWRKSVYKRGTKRTKEEEYKWEQLRQECFERDRFTCQRCEQKHKRGKPLSAHHIIPRIEGGEDFLENLITLFNPCHDFVEIHEPILRTLEAIVTSFDEDVPVTVMERTKGVNDEGYHFIRPEWHRWVYGSGKR